LGFGSSVRATIKSLFAGFDDIGNHFFVSGPRLQFWPETRFVLVVRSPMVVSSNTSLFLAHVCGFGQKQATADGLLRQ
jgi:hypothetical protein